MKLVPPPTQLSIDLKIDLPVMLEIWIPMKHVPEHPLEKVVLLITTSQIIVHQENYAPRRVNHFAKWVKRKNAIR